jgi:hypothetical protein
MLARLDAGQVVLRTLKRTMATDTAALHRRFLGPIHTMRNVSVPSTFHLRSVRMVCVHTVRPVQST